MSAGLIRHVALLRGVNVGRGHRVPMADWRALLQAAGYAGVKTLLNSGNAVFEAPRSAAYAGRIRGDLAAKLGVDVPVVVKSAAQWAAIVAGNTLGARAEDPSRLLVALASEPSTIQALQPLASEVSEPEAMHVGADAAYLWCPDGILGSRAAQALLGAAGREITTRNWATVLKIEALLH